MIALVGRDLLLSARAGGDTAAALAFFVVAASLFPFALGPAPEILARTAPGLVLVTALLAALLPLERAIGADYEDGGLERVLAAGLAAELVVLAKALVHGLTTALPLLLLAAPLALMLRVEPHILPGLLAALALAGPGLSLLGILAAALSVGARRAGVLIPLLVLPLAVPLLVFATGAADAAAQDLPARPHLLLLGACDALLLVLAPLAGGAALRAAVE
ncbi:MAG: heme exporter protein CcmB [Acetobacteraceae bacterium]|nr:heme exporter protein CcmB [Acetobacteraceae bacterium]